MVRHKPALAIVIALLVISLLSYWHRAKKTPTEFESHTAELGMKGERFGPCYPEDFSVKADKGTTLEWATQPGGSDIITGTLHDKSDIAALTEATEQFFVAHQQFIQQLQKQRACNAGQQCLYKSDTMKVHRYTEVCTPFPDFELRKSVETTTQPVARLSFSELAIGEWTVKAQKDGVLSMGSFQPSPFFPYCMVHPKFGEFCPIPSSGIIEPSDRDSNSVKALLFKNHQSYLVYGDWDAMERGRIKTGRSFIEAANGTAEIEFAGSEVRSKLRQSGQVQRWEEKVLTTEIPH